SAPRRCAAAGIHSGTGRRSAAGTAAVNLTWPGSVNRLGFLVHVVHQDVLAEGVRGSEVRLALADVGDAADEADQVVVAREHEGVDHDAALAARRDLGAGLGD